MTQNPCMFSLFKKELLYIIFSLTCGLFDLKSYCFIHYYKHTQQNYRLKVNTKFEINLTKQLRIVPKKLQESTAYFITVVGATLYRFKSLV